MAIKSALDEEHASATHVDKPLRAVYMLGQQ